MMLLVVIALRLGQSHASGTEITLGGNEITLDQSMGCSDSSNVLVALLIGMMGGAFACILPCCTLGMRAQRTWAQKMLNESNAKVCRAQASILKKMAQAGGGGEHGGSTVSYTVVISFQAKRRDGTAGDIRATSGVSSKFWQGVDVGSQIEVAYSLENEREFAIVDELKDQSDMMMTKQRASFCIFSCFAIIGLAIGGVSYPATGCFPGAASFVLLIFMGIVGGHVFFRLARLLAQSSFYVSSSGAPTPSETMLGVTAQFQS